MKKDDFKDLNNPVFMESVEKMILNQEINNGLCQVVMEECDSCPFSWKNNNKEFCTKNQWWRKDKKNELLQACLEFKKLA